MKKWAPTSWLLFASVCAPLLSFAQSQQPDYAISVRQLRIPPKAVHDYNQGMECLAKKDAAGSLPHFQRAIAEYAGYYEAYDRIGFADLQLWRVAEAEQAFRKAIELSGAQFAHPLLALGAILNDREKFAEAESVTRKGLVLDPDSWRGHYYLALALFGLNRLVEAEESVRETLRLKAEFPQAHLLLADIHCREEDYPSLLNDLKEYVKMAPEGPGIARVNALREFAQGRISGLRGIPALAKPQP